MVHLALLYVCTYLALLYVCTYLARTTIPVYITSIILDNFQLPKVVPQTSLGMSKVQHGDPLSARITCHMTVQYSIRMSKNIIICNSSKVLQDTSSVFLMLRAEQNKHAMPVNKVKSCKQDLSGFDSEAHQVGIFFLKTSFQGQIVTFLSQLK